MEGFLVEVTPAMNRPILLPKLQLHLIFPFPLGAAQRQGWLPLSCPLVPRARPRSWQAPKTAQ